MALPMTLTHKTNGETLGYQPCPHTKVGSCDINIGK